MSRLEALEAHAGNRECAEEQEDCGEDDAVIACEPEDLPAGYPERPLSDDQ